MNVIDIEAPWIRRHGVILIFSEVLRLYLWHRYAKTKY